MKKAVAIAVAWLCLFSGMARADTCGDLLEAKRENDVHKLRLLHDYPGTIAALFACAGSASNEPRDKQVGALVTYCGVTCLFIGMDNCWNLGGEVMDISTRENDIKKAAANYGCRLDE